MVEQLRGLVQCVILVGDVILVCAASKDILLERPWNRTKSSLLCHIGNGFILQVFTGSKNIPTLFESIDNIFGDCVSLKMRFSER